MLDQIKTCSKRARDARPGCRYSRFSSTGRCKLLTRFLNRSGSVTYLEARRNETLYRPQP
jgi:hypothetical protein